MTSTILLHARFARRRGAALVYLSLIMTVIMGFVSLGVDWGRVQVAKMQLQLAVDAIARYAAAGLDNDPATCRANALAAVNDNTVDGSPLTVNWSTDLVLGIWNSTTRTFTPVAASAESTANAVQISGEFSAARSNAIHLTFAALIGQSACDIHASSVALINHGTTVVETVSGTNNPWLAGEPNGTQANVGNPHNDPDVAGPESPTKLTGITLSAGHALTFDSVNGGTNNFSSSTYYTADGNTGWLTDNLNGAELGKSDVTAPINALMGVFLNNSDPAQSSPPSTNLDFSTDDERNFVTLTPQLKQVFFIGDGRRDDGELQRFIVPTGATRLYLGTMDGYEWSNNIGSYSVTIHSAGVVTTVK